MGEARQVRLRVGVIGLGRLWEARHKPALLRLRDRFQITALYDQVARRAELEATHLGCAAVAGITALIERPDVDVVYLLTPQWFGLYPVEIASACRKPVYCGLPPSGAREELERLAGAIESSGIAFMPELARRYYPATVRLRELLATKLGAPRLVVGNNRLYGFDRYGQPGPMTQIAPAPLLIDPGSYLLDWCGFVFGSEPIAVRGWSGEVLSTPAEGPDFEGFVAEYAGGGMAQVAWGRYHRVAWGEANRFLPQPGIQVFADRGAAWLELPDRIQWTDPDGPHEERMPLEPTVGESLSIEFHRLATGEPSTAPTIRDALAVARGISAMKRSQVEGRRIARDE